MLVIFSPLQLMKHFVILFETNEILDVTPVKVDAGVSVDEIKADFYCRINKEKYIETVNKLLTHIKRGDIYEINYFIEFFAENVEINPHQVFNKLNSLTEAPFAQLFKLADEWIICASPERFIQK